MTSIAQISENEQRKKAGILKNVFTLHPVRSLAVRKEAAIRKQR